MIVTRRIGQAEPHYHVIKKRRIGELDACAAKIIAGVKCQFVYTRFQKVAREQRLTGSAIGIGGGALHVTPSAAHAQVQIDDEILRRLAARCIEHMCGETRHIVRSFS